MKITQYFLTNRNRRYFTRFGEHDLTYDNLERIPRLNDSLPKGLFKAEEILNDPRTDTPTEQTIEVAEVIQYPEYVFRYHDIALLRLKTPVG